ncbi:MAG: DUF4238 domain-containing protein [Ruminococcaceae bacterium]|nr:DUF4238 domain-containing protein [Oscillospiraceae bacterium]
MVNSHYVPRLILRNFSENERINYCDFNNKKIELRNIKSVFSEKGYYPDEIEKDLCDKIEVKFANLLHNKILKERYKVVLNKDELFILKKYLIITSIRYNISKSMKNYEVPENYVNSYSENFYSNINKVLASETLEQMYSYIDPLTASEETTDDNGENYGEIKLFAAIKNIIQSYVAIVSTNRCKEDFIIPDVGFA